MNDKGSYNIYKNKHENKLNYKTNNYMTNKVHNEENEKNIKKITNYNIKNQNMNYNIMKYNSVNRNNYDSSNNYYKSFNNSPLNKNNMNYNYSSNNDDYYKYDNNYKDDNDGYITKSPLKNISKNELNNNANDIYYSGSYNYENNGITSNNKNNANYNSYSVVCNNNYDKNNNYHNDSYNNKMNYSNNDDYTERNYKYHQNINNNENYNNYSYKHKSNKQNSKNNNSYGVGEMNIINSDSKKSNMNYKNSNFTEKNNELILTHENGVHRKNTYTNEKNRFEENVNKKNNTCYNDNQSNYNENNIISNDSSIPNENIKENKNENEHINYDTSYELNEEEKNYLEKLLTDCEESKKDSINKISEWILKKCDHINNSKCISLYFYNKILKCVNFKNKLNLVFSYHELLRNFMLNNKKIVLAEFKVYMNSIIQDAYTCAYYKDQNSINVLLQMVYKWNELSINNFHETKTLLNIFHYENNYNQNNHIDKNKNEHSSYNASNKFLNAHHIQNSNYQNQKMPPPPPPPPLPSSNSIEFSKGYNLFEKSKKKDIDETKMSHLNNSTVINDANKNPEDISVGFLATLLKYISKKGKKLQNPLIPYTPIDVSYTYQTPPSLNPSEKLNEKINDFYDELKHIVNNEDTESSDISSDSNGIDAYENYKKLKNFDKKKKNYKNSNINSELCSNYDKLNYDKDDQQNYSSDTNTTFSSVELFDNSMIELLSDSNSIKKNKKSKNVNFSQIAIENAQNWNDEKDHSNSIFDYYSLDVNESKENDVFEKYRRNKAYAYHETIAQKFYDLKNKEI